MLEAIPVSEVRQNLLPLLSRIEQESFRFAVTRHGKPVAVIMGYEDFNRMSETLRLMENRFRANRVDRGLAEAREGQLVDIPPNEEKRV